MAQAEYGDKTSLVVNIVTTSGLDRRKPCGSVGFNVGSFNSPATDVNVSGGSSKVGDVLSFSGLRTDRFLDPPEFDALHDSGTSRSFFNRFDGHVSNTDAFRAHSLRDAT